MTLIQQISRLKDSFYENSARGTFAVFVLLMLAAMVPLIAMEVSLTPVHGEQSVYLLPAPWTVWTSHATGIAVAVTAAIITFRFTSAAWRNPASRKVCLLAAAWAVIVAAFVAVNWFTWGCAPVPDEHICGYGRWVSYPAEITVYVALMVTFTVTVILGFTSASAPEPEE